MTDATVTATARRPDGVWARLRRRPLALFGMALVTLIVGAALLAPWIAPFDRLCCTNPEGIHVADSVW